MEYLFNIYLHLFLNYTLHSAYFLNDPMTLFYVILA
jgi:hypothetical protein